MILPLLDRSNFAISFQKHSCFASVLFAVVFTSGLVYASANECAVSVSFRFLQTTITDVHRNDSSGLNVVSTENGKYFTKSATRFDARDGNKKFLLPETGSLEAALLENVGQKVVLLLTDEVDGLIVGLFSESGSGCVESILLVK